MHRFSVLLFLVGAFACLAAAASAPTFCKCTCFTNSTIIEIKPKGTTSSSSSSHNKNPPPESSDSKPEADPGNDDSTTDIPSLESILNSDINEIDPQSKYVAGRTPRDVDLADIHPDLPGTPEWAYEARHELVRRVQASPSCSQCNRAFCLSQSLPICKGAAEKDVATMCFQRDSRKDQVIVWGFILGTAGLLGWAAVRKVLEMQDRGSFMGLGGLGFGNRAAVPIGGGLGATGSDVGRGQYAAVGTHSRDASTATSNL